MTALTHDTTELPTGTNTAGENKAFRTLQARAALDGRTCTRTAIGNIILSRYGYASIFDDVAEASTWLASVTGR